MTLRYDLHCHSTYSDGLLPPADVVRRAGARGVDVLALTDHDETGGLAEAHTAAHEAGVRLINGAELSVSWRDITLHVVALGIDPDCVELSEGLNTIRSGRTQRAQRMGEELAAAGIAGAYAGAMKFVTSARLILRGFWSRPAMRAIREIVFGATWFAANRATWPINGQRWHKRSDGYTAPAARRCSRTRADTRSTERCTSCWRNSGTPVATPSKSSPPVTRRRSTPSTRAMPVSSVFWRRRDRTSTARARAGPISVTCHLCRRA